jgi:outer membrane lipoprotein SlyB
MMHVPIALVTSMLALAASAQQPADAPQAARCDNCGVVVAIQMSTEHEQWTPLGVMNAGPAHSSGDSTEGRSAFAFGRDGKRELIMIGTAGGAVYAKRPNAYQKPRWDVTVKMDDGSRRVVQQRYEPFVHEGDRVRIMGTQLELTDT